MNPPPRRAMVATTGIGPPSSLLIFATNCGHWHSILPISSACRFPLTDLSPIGWRIRLLGATGYDDQSKGGHTLMVGAPGRWTGSSQTDHLALPVMERRSSR